LGFAFIYWSGCDGGGSSGSSSDSSADISGSWEAALAAHDTTDTPITVYLGDEVIEIPNGRPAYALLVSGFHQNRNLDMFHFYNFAKCLLEKGAYVHYSWWNNLLAPYMREPLHDNRSVPSTAIIPWHDFDGQLGLDWPGYPTKAIPAEDHQFQADAEAMLTAIHQENPHAAIILVGHSMGGDAVVRLAASLDPEIDVDLLAPIDPVGNRTCHPTHPPSGNYLRYCRGWDHFKRFYTTRNDWFWLPSKLQFGTNLKYLYHRWQNEFNPPFDYLSRELFNVSSGTTNVQYLFDADPDSGRAADHLSGLENSGGWIDGHGEIVGFRGVKPLGAESYPLGLQAQGNWPYWVSNNDTAEGDFPAWVSLYDSLPPDYDREENTQERVKHMKAWDADSTYLDDPGGNLPGGPPLTYAPTNPEYCMVSEDLCTILRTAVNLPPVADAGPDRTVECSGPHGATVILDGSGSTDPNVDSDADPDDNPLTFTWIGPFGTVTGETPSVELPLGTHTIILIVEDDEGKSDSDTVEITVTDSEAPSLSISLSPEDLWPPNHELVNITASIQVSDSCDESPTVKLVSITGNEADDGLGDGSTSDDIQGADFGTEDRAFSLRAERAGGGSGRIYTVTYEAMDASGNAAVTNSEIAVPHDHGG
jgi:pimeloyl-ACP methyl ester carboxylesterase